MIFRRLKYLDWEMVYWAVQPICETACQCEIHCINSKKRNQTQIWNWVGSACYAMLLTEMLKSYLTDCSSTKKNEVQCEQPNMKFII